MFIIVCAVLLVLRSFVVDEDMVRDAKSHVSIHRVVRPT